MEVKPLEVLSEASNYSVVRMPGRNYPGCVIQGDSRWVLWDCARAVADGVRKGAATDEDFLDAVEELHNSLLARLLHYQEVLGREGISLPYTRPLSKGDFARLTVGPDEGAGA